MMRFILIIFGTILFLSFIQSFCNGIKHGIPQTKPYVSPQLKPYVQDYLEFLIKKKININGYSEIDSIIMVPEDRIICEDTTAIGCYLDNVICIKLCEKMEEDTSFYLKVLIYHELSHGILKIKHDREEASIMNPVLWSWVSKDEMEYNWDFYKEQLIEFYYHECVPAAILDYLKHAKAYGGNH